MHRFQTTRYWIFDLDNTLYPRHTNLFKQIDDRISSYVARVLNISQEAARPIQRHYYKTYGTTLSGLMREHKIDPDDFLEYVHDIDRSHMTPDPALGAAIAALPGRRFIFTNGSRKHAEETAGALGITDHFEDIFDIAWADLIPKPKRHSYDKLIAETGINPQEAAMFEDLSRNLAVPHDLGMQTVLILPQDTQDMFHGDWEMEGAEHPHVSHVTDDLSAFLQDVLAHLK